MAERLSSCASLAEGIAMVQQMATGVSRDDLAAKIAVLCQHHRSYMHEPNQYHSSPHPS